MNVCLRINVIQSANATHHAELHFRNTNGSRLVFVILALFGLIIRRHFVKKFAPRELNLQVRIAVLRRVISKRRHCLHDSYALQ